MGPVALRNFSCNLSPNCFVPLTAKLHEALPGLTILEFCFDSTSCKPCCDKNVATRAQGGRTWKLCRNKIARQVARKRPSVTGPCAYIRVVTFETFFYMAHESGVKPG